MRSYPLYRERKSEILDGIWDFAWLGVDGKVDEIQPNRISYDALMAVPGVFDTCPEHFGKWGLGVYRKKLCLDTKEGTRLRLKIGGLGLFARIWWDGKHLADYELPYSSVDYDFSSGNGREHELVIAVDNRFDSKTSPLFSPNFDFYAYGGIYRSVEIQQMPATFIERVQVKTLDLASGLVRLRLLLSGNIPDELEFALAFDGALASSFKSKLKDGQLDIEQRVPGFKIWSTDSPSLHTVTVSIDGDAIVERFGIRTVETRGQEILLNGKPLSLRGVNRHETHPEFGPVQTEHLMLDDLLLLKDLGCNFVRCVHYPQDQAFLDLCDQLGMLVWQESLGWNNSDLEANDERFSELQARQTRLMVENSINHPSVILWGFLNESCSETQAGRKLYETLAKTVRKIDPALLVTYASNKHEKDICFDLADVMAMNFYPGWWGGNWSSPTSACIKDIVDAKAEYASRPEFKDKPFLVSEIGVCALYGCHDRANAQWSEEYQAEYFTETCRCIFENPRYAGLALWQMFDTRSYVNTGNDVRGKPRGFNCAGLLDEYRRPKLAYDAVKQAFHSLAKKEEN